MHCTGYEEDDFTRRLDTELFPQLDGTPMQGPGGYTNQGAHHSTRYALHASPPPARRAHGISGNTAAPPCKVHSQAVRIAANQSGMAHRFLYTRALALTSDQGPA